MPLSINGETYLIAKDAAGVLGIARQTFDNYRSLKGDDWLLAHADLIPGRKFYRYVDVLRLKEARTWQI